MSEPVPIARKMVLEEAYRQYQDYCEGYKPPQRLPMFTFSGWLGHHRITVTDAEGRPWGG